MNKKSFISGVLVTILAMGMIGSAYAQTIKKMIEAEYRDIIIQINGKEISTVDSFGNTAEPFIVDGRTYLPVRAIGEALGLEVTWDDATSTVGLNETYTPNNNGMINYAIWTITKGIASTCDIARMPMILHGTSGETYENTKQMEQWIEEIKTQRDQVFYDYEPILVQPEWATVADLLNIWNAAIDLTTEEIYQFGKYTTATQAEKDEIFIQMRDIFNEVITMDTETENIKERTIGTYLNSQRFSD